jgi:hypothetical protein
VLPALLDQERRLMRRIAFALCSAAVGIIPLTVPSSFSAGAATAPMEHAAQVGNDLGKLLFPAIALGRDPFVPDAAFAASDGAAEHPQDTGSPIVRAVVSGAQAHALIEVAGVVRVVSIGDAVGNATVTAIVADAVLLSSGTRLPLKSERP